MTNPTSGGFVTVWNTGVGRPDASTSTSCRSRPWRTSPSIPLGTGGALDLFNAFGETDLLLDVSGYFL